MSTAEEHHETTPPEPESGAPPAVNGKANGDTNGTAEEDAAAGEATSADWAERCASCGARLRGRYCHACGEKVVSPRDYALGGFLRRALSTLTHLDGSVFRTYYYLVARPGFLTKEHHAGRRKRYLKPLQVFIIVNVAFYLFATWTGLNTFTTPLQIHLDADFFHSDMAARFVEAHLTGAEVSFDAYEQAFDRWATRLSKTLVFTLIPLVALLCATLQARRRRYFVEHLVFGSHFCAFLLLLLMLVAPAMQVFLLLLHEGGGVPVASLPSFDTVGMAMLATGIGTYMYFALRRRYEAEAAWLAFAKSTAFVFGITYGVIEVYRGLLFFIAFLLTT